MVERKKLYYIIGVVIFMLLVYYQLVEMSKVEIKIEKVRPKLLSPVVRRLIVYDYRIRKLYDIRVVIYPREAYDFKWYIEYPFWIEVNVSEYEGKVYNMIIREALASDSIQYLINKLKEISKGDKELYCNLALQITLQLWYDEVKCRMITRNETVYLRNPIKVLLDGKCICTEASLLYATLLVGNGIDVYLVSCKVFDPKLRKWVDHMMVAVKLDRISDPMKYHAIYKWRIYVNFNANIVVDGVVYYLADPSPGKKPLSPDEVLETVPTFVGEVTWLKIKVERLFHVSVKSVSCIALRSLET